MRKSHTTITRHQEDNQLSLHHRDNCKTRMDKKPHLSAQVDVSSGDRGLAIGVSPSLHPYVVCASSKALASLRICTGSSKHSLFGNAISTKGSCAS